MPKVTYIESNGATHTIEAEPGRNLMQIATENLVPGILGDCGGVCSCATCHAYVDPAWLNLLPARSETEIFLLEGVSNPLTESRLCCQIKMSADLDGIVLTLPDEQF